MRMLRLPSWLSTSVPPIGSSQTSPQGLTPAPLPLPVPPRPLPLPASPPLPFSPGPAPPPDPPFCTPTAGAVASAIAAGVACRGCGGFTCTARGAALPPRCRRIGAAAFGAACACDAIAANVTIGAGVARGVGGGDGLGGGVCNNTVNTCSFDWPSGCSAVPRGTSPANNSCKPIATANAIAKRRQYMWSLASSRCDNEDHSPATSGLC